MIRCIASHKGRTTCARLIFEKHKAVGMIRCIASHKEHTMCARIIFEKQKSDQMIRCIASHKDVQRVQDQYLRNGNLEYGVVKKSI
jgi:hypothetical protein